MTPKEHVQAISEKTNLPLSLALLLGGGLFGVVLWGGRIEARVAEVQTRAQEQEAKLEKLQDTFHSIDSRLSRIEGALGVTKK